MTVSIPLKCIDLREGSSITLHSQTWQDWENILEELGEDRHTRLAYYQGTLEIAREFSFWVSAVYHDVAGDER